MKLSQAATIILASAVAVGAFVPSVPSTSSTRSSMMTASRTSSFAPLAMSEVVDAETVDETAETYE